MTAAEYRNYELDQVINLILNYTEPSSDHVPHELDYNADGLGDYLLDLLESPIC
jgi:hypothetical protein